MEVISRGFSGRRRGGDPHLPPGQYLTEDFPVLSAGPTPRVPTERWEFTITTETGENHRWDWAGLRALASEQITVDLYPVTFGLGTDTGAELASTVFSECRQAVMSCREHMRRP